jgi:hypothetical protein
MDVMENIPMNSETLFRKKNIVINKYLANIPKKKKTVYLKLKEKLD